MSNQLEEFGPATYVFDNAAIDSDYACSAYNTGSYRAIGIAMPIKGMFCEVEYDFGNGLPETKERHIDYPAIVRKLDRVFQKVFETEAWPVETAPKSNVVIARKDCVLRQHHDGVKGSAYASGIRREFFSTIIVAGDNEESVTELLPELTGDEEFDEAERKRFITSFADIWPYYALPLRGSREVKVIESIRARDLPAAKVAISGLEKVIHNYQIADIESWL